MTWKDEFLMLWIFCLVVITYAARHLFDGAAYLVEHVAAASVLCVPGLLHLLSGRWR